MLGSSFVQGETLPQAVKYLLQSNPDIRAIDFNRKAREKEVLQARAGYYPTLDYIGAIGINDTYEPQDYTSTPKEHTLSLRQNIFRGFSTVNEVKRQEARVESASYRLQGVKEYTALDAADVYLNVLRHLELNELARENLLIHERIFDQMKLRTESGVDDKANLDQVTGRLALARSNAVVTSINVDDAKTAYQAVIGHYPEDLVKPQPFESHMPKSLEEAQQIAVDNHPILKSAQADLEARKAQDLVAESPFYPVVDLEIDRNWKDEVDDFYGWEEDLTAMIRLRFNLFAGGKDKARKEETGELIREAMEIKKQTHRQVVESIRLSWMANKAAMDKMGHLEKYVQSTSSTAEAFSKQWRIGKRTMFDVLDTEAEVINARKDLINTVYDGLYAQYRTLSGMGNLIQALGLEKL